MQVTLQRLSPVKLELAVEVPAAQVKAQIEKAYVSLQKQARVRGFRPGKTPRDVLARLFGRQILGDVANQLVSEALPKALVEKNLTPITQPDVSADKAPDAARPFAFKATFEVAPEVEDVKWEGFELERPSADVKDEEVDAELEKIRVRHAALKSPEPARDTKAGDVVTIDFTLAVDGKELKDGGGQGVQIELGSGQALPELDAALVGKPLNVPIVVEAKFAADHPRKELAGKVGRFDVTITDLKEKVLPALDDELAKDAGASTLVELRANVHTALSKAAKDRSDLAVAQQVVDKLNELNPVDVPPALVEQQRRMLEAEFVMNARRMGQRVTQADVDGLKDKLQADAEKKVRAGLLMAAIARKHEIKVTDEDFEKALAELAAESGKNVAKLRVEYRDKQKRDMLVGMILEDKILDLIESKAKITEKK
jgi:trigger factor